MKAIAGLLRQFLGTKTGLGPSSLFLDEADPHIPLDLPEAGSANETPKRISPAIRHYEFAARRWYRLYGILTVLTGIIGPAILISPLSNTISGRTAAACVFLAFVFTKTSQTRIRRDLIVAAIVAHLDEASDSHMERRRSLASVYAAIKDAL